MPGLLLVTSTLPAVASQENKSKLKLREHVRREEPINLSAKRKFSKCTPLLLAQHISALEDVYTENPTPGQEVQRERAEIFGI